MIPLKPFIIDPEESLNPPTNTYWTLFNKECTAVTIRYIQGEILVLKHDQFIGYVFVTYIRL